MSPWGEFSWRQYNDAPTTEAGQGVGQGCGLERAGSTRGCPLLPGRLAGSPPASDGRKQGEWVLASESLEGASFASKLLVVIWSDRRGKHFTSSPHKQMHLRQPGRHRGACLQHCLHVVSLGVPLKMSGALELSWPVVSHPAAVAEPARFLRGD